MAQLDQGYKIGYWTLFLIFFLHTYFIIFFTESKIRLSSKFHSKKWKIQTHGEIFDNILYIKEINQNEKCPLNYTDFSLLTWPGTYKGVFIDEFIFQHPCQLIDTEKKGEIENYRIHSIFSPTPGSSIIYTSYKVHTPDYSNCYDKKYNDEVKCFCPKSLFKFEKYDMKYGKAFEINNITETNNNTRGIYSIDGLSPQNLTFGKEKENKLCMKKVSDFTITYDKKCPEGSKLCYDLFCIKGEDHCPNNTISSFGFTNIENNIATKPISNLNVNYNGIQCSALNKVTYIQRNKLISEGKHILSKMNQTFPLDTILCEYNSSSTYEDIILLSYVKPSDLYKEMKITKKLDEVFEKKVKSDTILSYNSIVQNSNDTIYLTATTYFSLNETNRCDNDIFQKIKFSMETAKKISLINVGNIFILEFFFILSLCYILYKHFLILPIKTQPQTKFYYSKYLILVTFGFFLINLVIYYTNVDYKKDIGLSVSYLNHVTENDCFTNIEYMNHLREIKKRLDTFYLLSYQIYENLLIENIVVILLVLVVVKTKIGISELIRIDKNDDIKK